MKKFLTFMWVGALVLMLVVMTGCGGEKGDSVNNGTPVVKEKVEVAYVTNGIAVFWDIAKVGAQAAAKEFGSTCEVIMPPKGIVDQKRMVEGLLARGIDGVAISPIDADNQVAFLNQVAAKTNLITQDSDAPDSDRLAFIGMNNYLAGRAAGRLVKEALPEGGSVAIFVGRLEQLNSQQRRQGIIDELLDRPEQSADAMQYDPSNAKLVGDKYSVIDTRTDGFDYSKAKSNAEDMIATTPDLGCMVGLFAYNMPACIEAVKGADKLNDIKLVSFDEADETLQGITDGYVYGTISQQPYLYGYHSVRILTALAKGDNSVLPENGMLDVDFIEVRKDNIDAFWGDLKDLVAKASE